MVFLVGRGGRNASSLANAPWQQAVAGEREPPRTASGASFETVAEPPPSLKALVAEDDADVLEAAVELFKGMGYVVLAASDGLEAVELAKSHPDLDVLFTDLLMPGLDGVSVARQATRLIPDLKVVLVSGFPASSLATAGASDFDFLLKPYSRSQIARLLRK